jgi:hypothetical protein
MEEHIREQELRTQRQQGQPLKLIYPDKAVG